MCGIVGVVLKNNTGFFKNTEDPFFEMLFVDTVRGNDATGIIAVEKNSAFHIAKEANEASWVIPQFLGSKVQKDMYQSGKVYIGHNRKATQGKATDDNHAHPFVIANDFAMVHNGTLYQHRKLAETDVDSEALAIVLAQAFEKGDYKEAVEETLGKVDGAYAIAAYDQRTNKVHLLRNKERPLAIVETTTAWFFASEPGMLHWILSRNGHTHEELKNLRMVPVDTLFTFHLDFIKPTELVEEAVVPKKATPQQPIGKVTGVATTEKGGVTKITHSPKSEGSLSKNAWKRLKKQYMGKRVEFWADDYVERNFSSGKSVASGETEIFLLGQGDDFGRATVINAMVDLKDVAIKLDALDTYLFQGKVYDMEYDTKNDVITLRLTDVSLSYPSKTPLVIDGKYIQEKLDEKEKLAQQTALGEKPGQPTLH